MRIASSGSCVTSRTAVRSSLRMSSVSSRISSRSRLSRPENGSSIRRIARPRRQRARQRHPLLLAAGELVRILRGVPGEPDPRQQVGSAPTSGRARPVEPERDVLGDAEMGKQREVLEHQPDLPRFGRHMPRSRRRRRGRPPRRLRRPGARPRRRCAAAWTCRNPTDRAGRSPRRRAGQARRRRARRAAVGVADARIDSRTDSNSARTCSIPSRTPVIR